jgi:hypothetical protein
MYQALEAAVQSTGKSVVLIECGWHANEFIQKAYTDAALLACPSVRIVNLDGRNATDRQTAWASADVFCSLSDNIQETFGIVPIEAMAAGIPVVVSDWDGYKETVQNEVNGYRIPTLMPQAEMGKDLARRHALEIDSYDMYCGLSCSLVAVDVQAATLAFERLFSSAELRRQMGESGRKRAQEVFDWKHIIGQYEALWSQLNDIRASQSKELKPLAHPWPARMDPFHAFAGYPTASLTPQTMLMLVDADEQTAISRTLAYRQLAMVDFAKTVLPTEDEIRAVLKNNGTLNALDWVRDIPEARRPFVFRSLAWFLKLGILKVVS